jgi:hypothetical protein
MRSKKILMTTIAVVLGGFTGMSIADPAFVNIDYIIHADPDAGACQQTETDTDLDGYADSGAWVEAGEVTTANKGSPTAGSAEAAQIILSAAAADGSCMPTTAAASDTATTIPTFYFDGTVDYFLGLLVESIQCFAHRVEVLPIIQNFCIMRFEDFFHVLGFAFQCNGF